MAQVGTSRSQTSTTDRSEPPRDRDPKKQAKQGPRKRVSQACDRCRSRKDKCDGKKPACSTCVTNDRDCSYDANVKKRGLPEGYVRGMEKLWGLAVREVEDVEDNLLSALSGDGEALDSWNDEGKSETLVELWRKSQIFRGLDRLLSSLSLEPVAETGKRKRIDSELQASRKSGIRDAVPPLPPAMQSADDHPEWPQIELGELAFDRRPPAAAQTPFSHAPSNDDSVRYESILSPPSQNDQSTSFVAASGQQIPELPSETWHLLDVYFSYTHCWLPIIEKHDLLRISYQYSQTRNNAPISGQGSHAVLWAAIAYAKFQHRAINNIPRALGSVGSMVWTAERMYAQARSFIPNEEGLYDLGHVQALLILTLANMGTNQLSRAWSLIGQAVRIAIDLQLDQPLEHILASSKSRSRAKHVFLGCFVLDTLVGARLGRRPHLRTDEISIIGLLEEDGLEEWDPWTDCLNVRRSTASNARVPASILSTFNRLVQVLQVLNEVSCMIEDTANLRQVSSQLVGKLHAWAQQQPSPSHYDTDTMHSKPALSLLPHQYHLHAVYFTTLAASYLIPINQHQDTNLGMIAMCGRQSTELLSQYSTTFGLLIVPPTYEYYVKTAYDVIDAVQSSTESTLTVLNTWKRSLDYCLETIEPSWPMFEILRASRIAGTPPRRESQVAFDLISGSNQGDDSPIRPGQTPHSLNAFEAMSQNSPPPSQTMTEGTGRTPTQIAKITSPNYGSKFQQHGRRSFGQSSSGHGLPQNPMNIYENAQATFGMANNHISPLLNNSQPPLVRRDSVRIPAQGQATTLSNLYSSRLPHSMSITSDSETGEPVFGDLMRLDATEWTGNWDQSLVNLGFTDQDNMNHAFNTFCEEPDPFHSSNVFQQLVANSNAEAANFFDNSAFGGMAAAGMGMGMGLGELAGFGFGDENEGIEAGQILQALSAAGDLASGRPS